MNPLDFFSRVFTQLASRRYPRAVACLGLLLLLLATCLLWQPGKRVLAYGKPTSGGLSSLENNSALPQQQVTFLVNPAKLALGKEYEVRVYSADCNSGVDLSHTRLVAPKGNGIAVLAPAVGDKCNVMATVKVDAEAALGKAELWLRGAKEMQMVNGVSQEVLNENKPVGTVEIEIIAIAQGPIPPGLEPQVDLMWGVMEKKVVRDNFGHDIARDFYGIQMVIGNNSGYDLQIAGVGFRLPNPKLQKTVVPTNSYRATRGVLEREQEFGRRSIILNSLKATGGLLTGFLPFWRLARPRANAATWADIVNGPLVAGFELIVPDTTVRQLVRLDDQMLRDGMIVKNNSQTRTLVFVPKNLLNISRNVGPAKEAAQKSAYQRPLDENDKKKDWSIDPQYVMEHLGELVLVGQCITYLNRVQVISRPDGGVTPPPTITGGAAELLQGADNKNVVFTGTNLLGAFITAPDGFTVTSNPTKADPNGNGLLLDIKVDETVPPSEYPLVITTKAGASTRMIKVEAAAPDFALKSVEYKLNSQEHRDDKPMKVTLTGKGLATAKIGRPLPDHVSIKSELKRIKEGEAEFTILLAKNAEVVVGKTFKLQIVNSDKSATLEIKVVQ